MEPHELSGLADVSEVLGSNTSASYALSLLRVSGGNAQTAILTFIEGKAPDEDDMRTSLAESMLEDPAVGVPPAGPASGAGAAGGAAGPQAGGPRFRAVPKGGFQQGLEPAMSDPVLRAKMLEMVRLRSWDEYDDEHDDTLDDEGGYTVDQGATVDKEDATAERRGAPGASHGGAGGEPQDPLPHRAGRARRGDAGHRDGDGKGKGSGAESGAARSGGAPGGSSKGGK